MIRALVFLIDTFSQLYLLILLLRFWLPLLRANFQNPIAQGVLRYSSPLITPVRRYIPSVGRIDTATVLIAYIIQFLAIVAMLALVKVDASAIAYARVSPGASVGVIALIALVKLAKLSVTLFIVAIVIRVVLNLLGRYVGAISDMLVDLTEPVLRPIRRIVPPLGMFDISTYIGMILLIALNMALSDLMPALAP